MPRRAGTLQTRATHARIGLLQGDEHRRQRADPCALAQRPEPTRTSRSAAARPPSQLIHRAT
jgi:hypothetical protein